MSYIGNEPIVSATRTVTEVSATAGQTVFTANGGYTVGFIDVFVNGSKLTNSDFTATNGTTITLNEAAQASDIVRLEALGTFLTGNHVPLVGDSNITGNVNVSGNVGIGTSSPIARLHVANSSATSTSQFGNLLAHFASNATNADASIQISNGVDNSARIGIVGGSNLYFSQNGSERMRIDSSGRVTMPNQPAFSAKPTGSPQSSGVFQANTTLVNTGGHYSTSTYRFTAPIAGRYFFSLQLINNETAQSGEALLRKNGGMQARFYAGTTASGEANFCGSAILELAVNDYVDVEAVSGSYNQGYGIFCGYLLG